MTAPLSPRGRRCTRSRLDGETNRIQRMIDIAMFNKPNSDVFVYILCTRAGGLGVNLQSADTLVLFDSDCEWAQPRRRSRCIPALTVGSYPLLGWFTSSSSSLPPPHWLDVTLVPQITNPMLSIDTLSRQHSLASRFPFLLPASLPVDLTLDLPRPPPGNPQWDLQAMARVHRIGQVGRPSFGP